MARTVSPPLESELPQNELWTVPTPSSQPCHRNQPPWNKYPLSFSSIKSYHWNLLKFIHKANCQDSVTGSYLPFLSFKQNCPWEVIRKYGGRLGIISANPPRGWFDQSKGGDPRWNGDPRGTSPTFVFHSRHESQGKDMAPSAGQGADRFSTLGRHSSPCSHYTLLFKSSVIGILYTVQKSTAHN